METSASGRPLVQFLARLGKELESAAATVEDLHVLVEATIKDGAKSELIFREAQTVDILQQHLMALSSFVVEIARATPDSLVVETREALGQLKLSSLRERLEQLHRLQSRGEISPGELEML